MQSTTRLSVMDLLDLDSPLRFVPCGLTLFVSRLPFVPFLIEEQLKKHYGTYDMVFYDAITLNFEELEARLLSIPMFPRRECLVIKNAEKISSQVLEFFQRLLRATDHTADFLLVMLAGEEKVLRSLPGHCFSIEEIRNWENKDFVTTFFSKRGHEWLSEVKKIIDGRSDYLPKDSQTLFLLCRDLFFNLVTWKNSGCSQDERLNRAVDFLASTFFSSDDLPVFIWLDKFMTEADFSLTLHRLYRETSGDNKMLLKGLSFFQAFFGKVINVDLSASMPKSSYEKKVFQARERFLQVQLLLWLECLELLISGLKMNPQGCDLALGSYIESYGLFSSKTRNNLGVLREFKNQLRDLF